MKKNILLLTLFICSFGFAQQEIKLDIADALVIRSLEFSYEKYLTEESSFGVSVLFNLAKEEVLFRYNENMVITPYYRHYFTTDKQWNFFGEGFLGINSGNSENKYTDGALGLAVGTKYVASGGLVIDFYGGVGRNLFVSNSPVLVPRIGLNIGWRF
jgi:hypothetical protein